jgi:hypothetical protein
MPKIEIQFSNPKLAQLLQSQLLAGFGVDVELKEEAGQLFLVSEILTLPMIEHVNSFQGQVKNFARRAQAKKIPQEHALTMRSLKGCMIDGFSMSAVPGVIGEYGEMSNIIEEIDQFCLQHFASFEPKSLVLPQIVLRSDLVKMGYLPRDEKQVAELLVKPKATDSFCLSPAVCLGLYPQLAKFVEPNGAQAYFVSRGFAHRNEAGQFAPHPPQRHPSHRLRHFQVREVIWVGDGKELEGFKAFFMDFAQVFSQHFNLPIEIMTANDVFFEPADTKLAILQLINQSKLELIVQIDDIAVSIASFNDHQDHFTSSFLPEGHNRHSACIGIGLERAAYAVACVRKEQCDA